MQKLLALSLLSLSTTAQALFTFSIDVGALYTNFSFTDAPTQITAVGPGQGTGGAIGVLVADVSNGANGAFPQGADLFGKSLSQYANWGSSFYVINQTVAVSTAISGDGRTPAARFVGTLAAVDPLLVPGMSTSGGHPVALYWFPTIIDTNPSTSVATGITPSFANIPFIASYGFYTNTVAQNSGVVVNNNSFVTPPNAVVAFRIHAKNADALTAAQEALSTPTPDLNAFVAIPNLVPEPTTYAVILGLAVLGLGFYRRKALRHN